MSMTEEVRVGIGHRLPIAHAEFVRGQVLDEIERFQEVFEGNRRWVESRQSDFFERTVRLIALIVGHELGLTGRNPWRSRGRSSPGTCSLDARTVEVTVDVVVADRSDHRASSPGTRYHWPQGNQ